jgi:RNA polymerase sigma-70 factor (ECF subfamily)
MSDRPPEAPAAPEYATRASLIDRLQSADPAGWERLVELYRPLLWHWARRAGVPPQDIDDVCQDVFRVVAVRIGSFRLGGRTGSFRAWLRGITRNVCRERARADERAAGGTDAAARLYEVADPAAADTDPPELVADLLRRTVGLVRGEFSAAHWQVFERLAFDGRTPAEAAAELGLTEVNVRAIKSRIYRRLREELGDLLDADPADRPV